MYIHTHPFFNYLSIQGRGGLDLMLPKSQGLRRKKENFCLSNYLQKQNKEAKKLFQKDPYPIIDKLM